jgi:hypothetical protein
VVFCQRLAMAWDDETPELVDITNMLLICIFGRSYTTHLESV